MLMAELDHQVKNALARVVVIVTRARRTSPSIGEFVETVSARLQSLIDAHALLTRRGRLGVGLRELVTHQLSSPPGRRRQHNRRPRCRSHRIGDRGSRYGDPRARHQCGEICGVVEPTVAPSR